MKSKLSASTKHALTIRPLLTLSPLKEKERIERFMSGEDDIDTFIEEYPLDFYKLLRNNPDFADWFDKELALDVETVKMMTSVDTDNILELAKVSPKGVISMVLATKKSYFNFMKKEPMLFFKMARMLFPDITAEYYITKKIEKITEMWNSDKTVAFQNDIEITGGKNSIFSTTHVKMFKFWDTESSIPSLSNYFITDKSFITEEVLKKCREDKIARRKVHELFRMLYPLGLPHTEYLYTWDVLLLIRVWMIDRIVAMLDKLTYQIDLPELAKTQTRFHLVGSSYHERDAPSYEMATIWNCIKNRVEFSDKIKSMNPYCAQIEKDFDDDTLLSWPLDNPPIMDDTEVTVGPTLLVIGDDDNDENSRYVSYNKRKGEMHVNNAMRSRTSLYEKYREEFRANGKFRRILDLESLLEYYEESVSFSFTIKDWISKIKERKQRSAKSWGKTQTRDQRVEMAHDQVDLEILQTVQIYYKVWVRDVKRDMKRHHQDEMFVNSNLLSELNMNDLFDSPTECPFQDVFFPKEKDDSLMQVEEGETTNWEPYKECNRWLNFLSKRMEYMDKTPEGKFYGFGQGLSVSKTALTSPLTCFICKNETNQEEPHFNIPLCNQTCQMAWYKSKGILNCFV